MEWAGQGKTEFSEDIFYSLWKGQDYDKTPLPPCHVLSSVSLRQCQSPGLPEQAPLEAPPVEGFVFDTEFASLKFCEVSSGEQGGPGVPKGAGAVPMGSNWSGRAWGWWDRSMGQGLAP